MNRSRTSISCKSCISRMSRISYVSNILYILCILFILCILYILYIAQIVDIVDTVRMLYQLTDLVYLAFTLAVPRLGGGPSKIRLEGTHLPLAPALPPVLRSVRQLPHRDRAALPTVQCQGYQGMSKWDVLVKTWGESYRGYGTVTTAVRSYQTSMKWLTCRGNTTGFSCLCRRPEGYRSTVCLGAMLPSFLVVSVAPFPRALIGTAVHATSCTCWFIWRRFS